MSEIEGRVSEIKEEDYIICQSGARSTNVCQWLEMQGLTITNVQGGTSSFRGVLEY
jgi:rhodanese-related sulfurtransferase